MKKITNDELGRDSIEEFQKKDKLCVILLVDSVRSLNNIGSFFRTADAFAIEQIILTGISATPPNKEIHKTALGAELSVKWSYMESAVDAVSLYTEKGYKAIAIEQVENSVMLDRFAVDKSEKYMLIVGNEIKGVSQEVVDLCDSAIEIPQIGTKHSLNVAVAAGIVLWHFFKELK